MSSGSRHADDMADSGNSKLTLKSSWARDGVVLLEPVQVKREDARELGAQSVFQACWRPPHS